MIRATAAPPALRALHALVFLSASAAALVASEPEWRVLGRALRTPYSPGEPPQPAVLAGAVAAAGLGVFILVCLGRRRPVPLATSVGVIAALSLTLFGLSGPVPRARTWASADVAILKAATALQREATDVLQQKGEVPADGAAWSALLAAAAPTPVPVHRGLSRSPLSYQVRRISTPEETPSEALVPGTMLVTVSSDRASFTLRPVGLDATSRSVILSDDRGQPVLLRGTFNPAARTGEPSRPSAHETKTSPHGL